MTDPQLNLEPDAAEEPEAPETEEHAPEVVVEEPTQLAPIDTTPMELAHRADAVEIMDRWVEMQSKVRDLCIRATRPRDWLLTRTEDADGNELLTAELTASGADIILTFHGACPVVDSEGRELPMYGPCGEDHADWMPRRLTRDKDVGFEGWARARSRVSDRVVTVRMARWASEEFGGRKVDRDGNVTASRRDGVTALETDLKSALHSGLKKKLAVELSGVGGVTVEDLEDAGLDIGKCRLGHGFGSSADRSGAKVVSEDIELEQELLRREIWSLVNQDAEAGKDVLREISSWKSKSGKSGYARSVQQLTQDWQIERAWKRLREHEVFGADVSDPQALEAKREQLRAER